MEGFRISEAQIRVFAKEKQTNEQAEKENAYWIPFCYVRNNEKWE